MATKSLVSRIIACTLASASFALAIDAANAAPPIRTSESNKVPACVTPERLMAFIGERNPNVDPRFREIAHWYKHYGEGWGVRWDYAFYQMVIETNYLKFRREGGKRGDVWENQNNFAGIGATGGGVRGEFFPNIQTGVHAQIQHLVAYSGERLAAPVAKRTRENQDDIAAQSKRLGRPVTFGDLARRWAADRAYGKSIDFIAGLYQKRYCDPAAGSAEADAVPAPLPMRSEWRTPFRPPSGLGGPVPDDQAQEKPAAGSAEKKPAAGSSEKQPAAAGVPKKAAAKAAKPASKPSAASKSPPKVKQTSAQDAHSKKRAPDSFSPQLMNTSWAGVTVVERQLPAQSGGQDDVAQAPEPAVQQAAAPSSLFSMPWLPTFKITPTPQEPSRLGGPLPAELGAAAKAAASAPASPCKVLTASYGGTKTLLIRSHAGAETQYTALTIVDGFEKSMFDAYARTEAVGAEIVGEYATPEAALVDAKFNCPEN
ncbi:glucosaminidase domain-containing protein [Hyphomicrobium facile]|uniref:Mannosyl-glycoprotein endo-beta-N-acetylglucosaminidase n=1 Tax=Hyphomicrobium facile TaxID=51670 RepID=A0A1I7NH07_9HYPH|nr:glucosaminidase domain-containing protein [Hyphomicrobium facile]SFV33923.1 Mannosyl-glycoprotein endo-beta-N-acetylglucosaminidase [Hyphomicrobium facile]